MEEIKNERKSLCRRQNCGRIELNDIMIPSHALKTSVVIGGMIYRKQLAGLSTKSRLLAG